MIDAEYCQTMAAYNGWMNRKVYDAAARLSDAERKADRGVLPLDPLDAESSAVGDRLWLSRFNGKRHQTGGIGVDLYDGFDARGLRALRWTTRSPPGWHSSTMRNSPARSPGTRWFAQREMTRRAAVRHADVQPPDAPPRSGDDAAEAGRHRSRRDRDLP
jgi:uncharacterized damage-inducible protein DinB